MLLLYLMASLAVGYLLIVVAMYFAQTRLVFPTYLASFAEIELPSSAQRLRITGADGNELAGVIFSPTSEVRHEEVLLLGFGGNVWNVEDMVLSLHRQFPSMHVAGFHYRGYRPSGGRPSARGVLADALEIFDKLQAQLPPMRTIAIGFSIGTPVAAYLARQRDLDGLILVTPFDTLVELARDHFPWLPVRLLLRHKMSTLDFIKDVSTPTLVGVVAGLVPCPLTLFAMFLALAKGVLAAGLMFSISMVLGVALTLVGVALLTILCRDRIVRLMASHGGSVERVSRGLDLLTGALLLTIGALSIYPNLVAPKEVPSADAYRWPPP